MKKSLLIAAAVLITFGACTNDDSAPGQEITFKSVNQRSSKAGFYGPMTDSEYKPAEHFGVYAFLNKGNETTPEWATNNFMTNVEIQRIGEAEPYVWKNATTTYYWPSTGSLTFACYSPYGFKQDGKTDASVVSADKVSGISFTGFTAPTANDKQIDLMVADLITDKTSQSVALGVTFKHVLSQIKFAAVTTTDFTSTINNVNKIEINSLKVHQLNTIGTYSSPDGTFDNVDAKWSSVSTPNDYTISSSSINVELNKTPAFIGEPILIIPQDAKSYHWDSDNKKIFEITYTITFKDGSEYIPSQKIVYVQPSEEWKKGYIYTYTMQIGLNEITFSPAVVEKWAD